MILYSGIVFTCSLCYHKCLFYFVCVTSYGSVHESGMATPCPVPRDSYTIAVR